MTRLDSTEVKEIEHALEPILGRLNQAEVEGWTIAKESGWTELLSGPEPMLQHAVVVAATAAHRGSGINLIGHLIASHLIGVGDTPLSLGLDGEISEGLLSFALFPARGATVVILDRASGEVWTAPRGGVQTYGDIFDVERGVVRGHIPISRATPQPSDQEVRLVETLAALLLAADSLGAARRCLERTHRYLLDREQFGRPLGSFQVLQHRYVDMMMVVNQLNALVADAATSPVHLGWQAKSFADDRATWLAEQSIQLHGAMGFTWEAGLHSALRRTRTNRALLGGPTQARESSFRSIAQWRIPDVADASRWLATGVDDGATPSQGDETS